MRFMRIMMGAITLAVVAVLAAGCGGDKKTVKPDDRPKILPPPGLKDQFLLSKEPSGAKNVIAARKDAKNDEEVVVVGRIGGSENPWVKDRAAFSIVDLSLKACSDIKGDDCPAPWDYCCELPKLPKSKAFVKFLDEHGKLVKWDARTLFQIRELQTVFVKAKAQRDKEGNLTLIATGLFPGSTDPPNEKKKQ